MNNIFAFSAHIATPAQPSWLGIPLPVWTALMGTVLGGLLSLGSTWWKDRKIRRAHWASLKAEVSYLNKKATEFKDDFKDKGITSPLYRLPMIAYAHAFPPLLATGSVLEHNASEFLRFYETVESLNRGLDQVNDLHQKNQDTTHEHQRNLLKAQHIQEKSTCVLNIIDSHLKMCRVVCC